MYLTNEFFKDALSLKIKKKHIPLYFIEDANNLCNNVLVEYIDNWTQSYILAIIYQIRQK